MKRGSVYWGAILILIGVLLLLDNLDLLDVDVWAVFWPALLILFGIRILWGNSTRTRVNLEKQHVSQPLEGAAQARLRLSHGAGRLRIDSAAMPKQVFKGDFEGGLELQPQRMGDTLELRLRPPEMSFTSFPFNGGFNWNLTLNRDLPLELRIEGGASEMRLDLRDTQVTDLVIKTGASDTEVTLPQAAGHTRVRAEAGAAALKLYVPAGVAARVKAKAGLASVEIDQDRFPRGARGYQSPDFEAAENRVEIEVEGGVGAFEVRGIA
jgi:hypothetical protein